MKLRDYQVDCLNAIKHNYALGVSRQLVVLPTGSGKMVIAANLPDALGIHPPMKVLFLVHRDELIQQAADKFKQYNPDLRVEIEKARMKADPDSDVVVASVQSIGRENSPRLTKFDPALFALIVIDECHHATARSYKTVLQHFGALKGHEIGDSAPLLVGITATPGRSDNIGLEEIFDQISFHRDIRSMIQDRWLVDIEAHRVWTDTDISGVTVRQGDFVVGKLEEAVNTPARNELVVKKYLELGNGLPALAFTVDIQHSKDLAQAFMDHGIEAFALSGKTPPEERRDALVRFQELRLPVITSCNVLSEGVDLPVSTVGLMARPTTSTLLFCQQVGRLLRPWPPPEHTGDVQYYKKHAKVLDFVDNSGRHSLINLPTIFGLRSMDLKGTPVTKALQEIEQLEARFQQIDLRACSSINEAKVVVEKVNLFQSPVIPEIVRKFSKFSWLGDTDSGYRLTLPDKTMLMVRENHLGQAEIWRLDRGTRAIVTVCPDLRTAFYKSDQLVPASQMGAVLTKARWRNDPPTEAQAYALYRWDRNLRSGFQTPKDLFTFMMRQYNSGNLGFTKGSVSSRISSLIPDRLR